MDKKTPQPRRQLHRFAESPPLDIVFQDLMYSVPDSGLKSGWRQLLKSINGKFPSGELTAILGPSGAGKSTLLNILAGYVTAGVKGSIKINGKPRELKTFNKLSSYIMQEDLLQPRLSVREAMLVAANLKLGSKIGLTEKYAAVDEVINLLGLQKCYETRTEHLSGGQRRRLSIALELVNNPPIIFLDEPTTGLDNVAIKKCMELLHKISKLGRTVICTIHQPPASLFQNFDQVYVMSDGYCVYNGSPSKLVPFMSNANCVCPTTSTPADYIIELVQSNPENTNVLQMHAQNGKCNMREWKNVTPDHRADSYGIGEIYKDTPRAGYDKADMAYAASVWTQFWIILYRTFLQMSRNKPMLYIQFFHHLISGLLIGGIFLGTGNDGGQTMSVFKFCITINVFFMYTYVMSPVLLFPLELQLIRREYFNRWYSLKAYFLAVTVSNVPLLVLNGLMFNVIVYILADQPWEWQRFFWFNVMGLTVGLCSQGLGYAVGASCSVLNGCVVAPHIIAVLLAFAVYGMGYREAIEPFMKVMMSLSYLRDGLEGFTGSLFYLRKPLECEDVYCHYRNPAVLMDDMGMKGAKPSENFLYVCISLVLFRVIAYVALKYRMTSELRNKLVHYAAKIVKQNEN